MPSVLATVTLLTLVPLDPAVIDESSGGQS
jgi:hypothetical protein